MKEGDFSRSTRDASILSGQASKEKEYWLKKLSGELTRSIFYRDHEKAYQQFETADVNFKISNEQFSWLKKLSGGYDYTMHMILAAAVTLLLHRYTGNQDIIIGTPIYKQNKEAEFVNTVLALRNQVVEEITFKAFLLQTRQTILEAEEHQNYPIETLIYHLNLPAWENEFPLFDVAVLLENIHDKKYIQPLNLNVMFSFMRREEHLEGEVQYNSHLYNQETVERMVNHFLHLMDQVLADVNLKIGLVEPMTDEEKKQLIIDFNDTHSRYPAGETLVDIFERQVEKTPDHTALVASRQLAVGEGTRGLAPLPDLVSITYRELNKKSNQLAHLLQAKGVRPDTIVGIMVDRTIDTVIGIIGILKAGGAYLPIDPEAPGTRIAAMLEEAGAATVLAVSRGLGKFVFTTLQGLRQFNATPLRTAPRPPIKDLDALPYPDRSLIDYGKYNQYIGQSMAKNIIVIQATRGCPYHCAYCHKIWPKTHVWRSAENIFSEIRLNYQMGMRKFAFVDDIFNLNRRNSEKFFQLVIQNELNKDIQFYFPNGLRGDILTEAYIDLMVEAGTVSCALALETASPRLQKLIHKNLNLEKFRKNIEYLCQKYPQVILELFTMHGFPSETEEEAMMTLDFLKSMKWIHFPYINMLKIYPNTDMEQLAIRQGVTRASILRSENFAHFELSDNSPLEKSFTLNYRSDFLYNYFLRKERLLHVLPHQMKVLTRDEMVQKYNSYLPTEITGFEDLLKSLGIKHQELGDETPLKADTPSDFHLNWKERCKKMAKEPSPNALRVLLLDLSQFFTRESEFFYDVTGEAPLGMLYLLTYLNHRFGSQIKGKIAKSRIDFDSFDELKTMVAEFQPDVIGLRSLNIYKDFFHKTLAILRQWGIAVPIIAGGPYATSDLNRILQDPHLDLVVIGEGEVTFGEVIRAIIKNNNQLPEEEELKKIQGIAFVPKSSKERTRKHREILMIDALEGILSGEAVENPTHVNQPTDLAYSIFTSGSTGKPKGVLIEHRNVHNLVHGLNKRIYSQYAPVGYLKVGMVSPFVFDASVKQIFGALLQGHGLHIVSDDVRVDLESLAGFYRKHPIDVADGTPAHISMLTEAMQGSAPGLNVRHFLIGGESLPRNLVKNFFACFTPGTYTPKITNVYGPTECSVDTTAYQISRSTAAGYHNFPIGTPMPNFSIYILDRQKRLLPVGVPGELLISGAGVGRGYLNNPQLTADKFCCLRRPGALFEKTAPGPHKNFLLEGTRGLAPLVYRTGDLARWLPGGNIHFVGRKDQQLKIRGFRIEPGEIENHLLRHKDIKETVVVAIENKENRGDDKFLCAYIVAVASIGKEKANVIDTSELKEYLTRELPEYMIPSHFVQLEQIPLTFNGKVDPRALPVPEITRGNDYAAPQNPCQEVLVDIWSDILKIEEEKISIDANFFKIGGHSLKAAILIARIHKRFEVKIPLAVVFKTPTIRELARHISGSKKTTFTDLKITENKEYYSLSYNQKRLWVIHQMESYGTAYNMTGVVTLEHPVSQETIKKVLHRLMMRHESFRTGIKVKDNQPVQFVVHRFGLPFNFIDISSMKEKEKQEEQERIFWEFSRTLFDLTRPPLLRMVLVKLASRHYELIISMHHIVSDGWSIEILRHEFNRLYQGYYAGREAALAPIKFQYKEFAEWQNRQLNNPTLRESAYKYWKNKLENTTVTTQIPGDFRGDSHDNAGAAWRFVLDNQMKERIDHLAEITNTTPFTVMFSALILLISYFSNQEEVICSIISSGREHVSLHYIIGFFVNSVIFPTHVDVNETFADFLQRTKRDTMEVFHHQYYPIELILERLKMKYPHVPVSFNMLNMQDITTRKTLDSFDPYHIDSYPDVKFDMECYLNEYKNGIEMRWTYKKKLYKPETLKYIIGKYIKILDYFTTHPEKNFTALAQRGKTRSIW